MPDQGTKQKAGWDAQPAFSKPSGRAVLFAGLGIRLAFRSAFLGALGGGFGLFEIAQGFEEVALQRVASQRDPVGAEVVEVVEVLGDALREAGVTFDFTTYDGAGHAFFNVDRPSYRPEAAADGWRRIFDFLARTVG